jgi:lipoate---protein ligase
MTAPIRILDTGLLTARRNLALTAALAELHRAGSTPDILRFQDFHPAAIVGRHQSLAREVRLDRCRDLNVETARRMTGGGAIYMGPGLLGWELIVDKSCLPATVPPRLDDIARHLCTGLATGLRTLGIDAQFRPRNDIEVDGRKISGTGGYVDGRTLVFQGTVLIDFDVSDMAEVLTLPAMKRDRKGIDALAERVTSLRRLLGSAPPREAVTAAVARGLAVALAATTQPGTITALEQSTAGQIYNDEAGTDDFVNGADLAIQSCTISRQRSISAGILEVHIDMRSSSDPRINRIWIMGDVFVSPPRAIPDLEAALAGIPARDAATVAERFLAEHAVQILGGTPGDLVAIIKEAAEASS